MFSYAMLKLQERSFNILLCLDLAKISGLVFSFQPKPYSLLLQLFPLAVCVLLPRLHHNQTQEEHSGLQPVSEVPAVLGGVREDQKGE